MTPRWSPSGTASVTGSPTTGLDFDYVLYSHYERQVEDLVAGRIDAAWNSPLAWVRTRRLAPRGAGRRHARHRSRPHLGRGGTGGLNGRETVRPRRLHGRDRRRRLPQGRLLPLALLDGVEITVRSFDVGVGLHGDHVGGERDAARALIAGKVDAACMLDGNHLLFTREGTLPAGATRVIAQTRPFDHCNMSVVDDHPRLERFVGLLLGMDYADASTRPLMDLEGLTRWLPGRETGYTALEAAVDRLDFYDRQGRHYRRWLPSLRALAGWVHVRWTSVRSGSMPAATCCSTMSWRTCSPASGCGWSAEDHTSSPTWAPGAAGAATRSWATWWSGAMPANAGWREPSAPARPTGWRSGRPPVGVWPRRGALVEQGAPPLVGADLDRRQEVWTDLAPKLYAQAAAGQWDPATAVDWTPPHLADEVEAAVVQVMTYLVENEQAALLVPARFLGRVHPHFRETMQFLATQLADEARHVEVFTRRARLCVAAARGIRGRRTGVSADPARRAGLADRRLPALGAGRGDVPVAPVVPRTPLARSGDRPASPIFRSRTRPATSPSPWATWASTSGAEPSLRPRLAAAVRRRHDALASTAGLSDSVHDALVVLAAGEWSAEAISRGWTRVQQLQEDMDEGRRRRLVRLGFTDRRSGRALGPSHPQLHVRAAALSEIPPG